MNLTKKLLLILCITAWMSSVLTAENAHIKKQWDINIDEIFSDSTISKKFAPIFAKNKLIFGSTNGKIKSIHSKTKKIEYLLKVPLDIEESLQFTSKKLSHFAVFYGKHHSSMKYYYCSVNLETKKVQGVVSHDKEFLPFGEFAIFEKGNSFIVFNPKVGRGVYRQKSKYIMNKPVFTQDYKRHPFQTNNQEIVDIVFPKFGGSLLMSPKSDKKDVLTFDLVVSLDADVVADNIKEEHLFYHRKNGNIGHMNVELNKVIWERKYFTSDMTIEGPYVIDNLLFYLVSYPQSKDAKSQMGKLICLNKKTGTAQWVSDDLPFNNFGIVQFDNYIISSDTEGNILFLDYKTGELKEKYFVGEGMATPIVHNDQLYVMTNDKLIHFTNTRMLFKLKLYWDKLMEKLS